MSDATRELPVRSRRRHPVWAHAALGLAIALSMYLAVAYFLMPALWKRYELRHPAIAATPDITRTADDHPGDPINVALIGSEDQIHEAMRAAGWFPADPLGLASDLKIAADTVLKRPYDQAPVSSLYLFGRKEDLAFEKPVGNDPSRRHHVRFWKAAPLDDQGRPAWMGSATYDKRVGLSHTTGQITHHIDADVDAERELLFGDLRKTGQLAEVRFIDDFHSARTGANGGGDRWHTDGRLEIGLIGR
jgi:hypothetical protein